jgi:formylglycine-generating enzyme required for sulfatase activity
MSPRELLPQTLGCAIFVLLVIGCDGAQEAPTATVTGIATTLTGIPMPPTSASAGDTWTRPADGAVMVYVPSGEFLMGSTEVDIDAILAQCSDCKREWFTREQPQHTVYLDAFWIDKTEVTNDQYQ